MKQVRWLILTVSILSLIGQSGFAEKGVIRISELRALAEQGDASAQFDLGIRHLSSEGVMPDYTDAANCCRKAAEQGYSVAQSQLDSMYSRGEVLR